MVLLSSSTSNAGIILFDEFAIGTEVDDEYRNVGLVFSTSGTAPAIIVDIGPDSIIGFPTIPTASSTGLRISPFTGSPILSITFVDPVDEMTQTFATFAAFSFVSDAAGEDFGQIRAFNEFNVLVDFEISSVGGTAGDNLQGYETLSVSGTRIMRVEIDGFDTDVIIDKFEFTPVAPAVPALSPLGTALLALLAGLAGVARLRRVLT